MMLISQAVISPNIDPLTFQPRLPLKRHTLMSCVLYGHTERSNFKQLLKHILSWERKCAAYQFTRVIREKTSHSQRKDE